MPEDGRVAVVVTAHNAGSRLAEALDSVFAQDAPAAEVVVVDEGSTDDTRAAAEGYGRDVRVLPAGRGAPGRARNLGIAATRADLVAFLEAKDLWAPEKTSRQIALLDAHPDIGMVFSDARLPDAPPAAGTLFQQTGFAGACTASSIFLCDMIAASSVIVRRGVLNACGGFDEALACGQDEDLWFRIALNHRFAAIAEPLMARRPPSGAAARESLSRAEASALVWSRHVAAIESREPHLRRLLRGERARRVWEHRVLEGAAALDEGRRADARRSFLEAVRARPSGARAWGLLGATFLGEGTLRKMRSAGMGGRP